MVAYYYIDGIGCDDFFFRIINITTWNFKGKSIDGNAAGYDGKSEIGLNDGEFGAVDGFNDYWLIEIK